MPTAEDTENLPPTQSQKPKAFCGSMPNASTAFRLVLHSGRKEREGIKRFVDVKCEMKGR